MSDAVDHSERIDVTILVRGRESSVAAAAAIAAQPVAQREYLDRAQFARDLLHRVTPGHRHVLAARRVVAQRVGQSSGLLKVVIVPAQEFGDGVLGEEVRRAAMGCQFPGDRLHAVLAVLERQRTRRLYPSAAIALVAVDLVVTG